MNYCSKTSEGMAWQLAQLDWAIMGTLTWNSWRVASNSSIADQERKSDFVRIIGITCAAMKLRPRDLLVYGKSEYGAGNRGHYCCLIGRRHLRDVEPMSFAWKMQQLWTDKFGLAEVIPFEKSKYHQAIRYQTKQEFINNGQAVLHDEYLSPGLKRFLFGLAKGTPAAPVKASGTGFSA